jgi:hypothetical protein
LFYKTVWLGAGVGERNSQEKINIMGTNALIWPGLSLITNEIPDCPDEFGNCVCYTGAMTAGEGEHCFVGKSSSHQLIYAF